MMKRLILLFILTFPVFNSFAHIKFMGIEITGQYDVFKDSLETKGFLYESSFATSHTFSGIFANEFVTVEVLTTPKTKMVCKVIVYFSSKNTWEKLKTDYYAKKTLFKSKYLLDKDYEYFSYPYENGDGYEMRAVVQGKCNFISFFFAMGGHIWIEINKSAQVTVTYEDNENIKKAQKELENNALDDI